MINGDQLLKELGAKTQMNMDLAVQLNETGAVYSLNLKMVKSSESVRMLTQIF